MLSITKLYIQIVFMNNIVTMNIRILGGINLVFVMTYGIQVVI
jgi:hypothetical protein